MKKKKLLRKLLQDITFLLNKNVAEYSKLLIFFKKKLWLTSWKTEKTIQDRKFSNFCGNCIFLALFCLFHHFSLMFFWKNNKSFEHLIILLRIFFVLGVFKKFDVHFWTLPEAEKVRSWNSFCRNLYFLKISFSNIDMNL